MGDSEDIFNHLSVVAGLIIVLIVGILMGVAVSYPEGLIISNSTAHDICSNLINSSVVEPSVENGKLICTIPSYDHTTNIIVKKAGTE